MKKSGYGFNLQAIIREHAIDYLGVPFDKAQGFSERIMNQLQTGDWLYVPGDRIHTQFDRGYTIEDSKI